MKSWAGHLQGTREAPGEGSPAGPWGVLRGSEARVCLQKPPAMSGAESGQDVTVFAGGEGGCFWRLGAHAAQGCGGGA